MKMPQRVERILLLICILFIGIIYFHNIARDIFGGDNGDLVTAAYVLGVAHPPGYPLLMIFGYALSHSPISLPVVSKVALVSVFSSLIALLFFYRLTLRETKSILISTITTLILAFSYLFWLYTELPEVFALNTLFVIMQLSAGFRFIDTGKFRYLYFLAFFCGLSLTNQHEILLLYPALVILIARKGKCILRKPLSLFYASMFFLSGLLPYIYIPIAASRNPPVNWDHATNLSNFFRLVLRQDYNGISGSSHSLSLSERLPILHNYLNSLISEYSLLIFIICLLGSIWLFVKNKSKFSAILIAFILSGPLCIFYIDPFISQVDQLGIIERLYIQSFVVFLFCLPYGLLFIKQTAEMILSRKIYTNAILSVFFVVPIMMVRYNFPKTDLSKSHIGDTYGYQLLAEIPKNGVFIPYGDVSAFNTWYVHYVLGFRPDIEIINFNSAINSPLLKRIIYKYIAEHPKERVNDDKIVKLYIQEVIKKRQIYALFLPAGLSETMILIPRGLNAEMIQRRDFPEAKIFSMVIRHNLQGVSVPKRASLTPAEQNGLTPNITSYYSDAYTAIGKTYLDYYDDQKTAEQYFQKAVEVDYENHLALADLGTVQFLLHRPCKQTVNSLEKAIYYYPLSQIYYWKLRKVLLACHSPKEALRILAQKYTYYFHSNMVQDMQKLNGK